MDFAAVNLRYLLALRELARDDPHVARAVAGIPDLVIEAVAALNDQWLLDVSSRSAPLMRPCADTTWWARLADAALTENEDEFTALLENDPYCVRTSEGDRSCQNPRKQ